MAGNGVQRRTHPCLQGLPTVGNRCPQMLCNHQTQDFSIPEDRYQAITLQGDNGLEVTVQHPYSKVEKTEMERWREAPRGAEGPQLAPGSPTPEPMDDPLVLPISSTRPGEKREVHKNHYLRKNFSYLDRKYKRSMPMRC